MDKCKFFEKEVDYLGPTLSKKGIRQQVKKLEVISDTRAPKNMTELL